jgi:hypothetical protein
VEQTNALAKRRGVLGLGLVWAVLTAGFIVFLAAQDPAGGGELPPGQQIAPPPFSEGVFPCSQCHLASLMPLNTKRRVLTEMHQDIVLHHDEKHRWCLDCHDAVDRDRLHSASGEPIPFAESYRLCGQCHGNKLRDWQAGVHGKRTGYWNGEKRYLLCVNCHNPHDPKFRPLKPEPPPRPPVPPARGRIP